MAPRERTPERRNGVLTATYSLFPEPAVAIPEERPSAFSASEPLPRTARFVAQFKPWQLGLILILGSVLLLLTPTA
jgi:hypothetical protein